MGGRKKQQETLFSPRTPRTLDLLSLKGSVRSRVKGVSVEQMQQAIAWAARRK